MEDISGGHDIPRIEDGEGPVVMPDLPTTLVISTAQQMKACADPTRSRILGLIQHQPATATQLAQVLGVAPNKISYHLRILEAAGLAQVVARRLIRGIVAKYYTRTARNFLFEAPPEIAGEAGNEVMLGFLTDGRDELREALEASGDPAVLDAGFPHARLTAKDARVYEERLEALVQDFMNHPPDPCGRVYALSYAYFLAPPSLQGATEASDTPKAPSAATERQEDAR
jgi:DNA-binding transcriptional ArsR family regulator